MASKYDEYWRKRLDELQPAIEQALRGKHAQLDVSDIVALGDRSSWYGRAVVRGRDVVKSSMAHMTSLARQIAETGLCSRQPDAEVTFTVDSSLCLSISAGEVRKLVARKPLSVSPSAEVYPSTESQVLPSEACRRVHGLLTSLPRFRSPSDVPIRNGLYFFFEKGEVSDHSSGGRVVRVGNHPRSQGRLKGRLRDHYRSSLGAKNGSIFRRYMGGALLRRRDPDSSCLGPAPGQGHWEHQNETVCNTCGHYEEEVTKELKEKFEFSCVEIEDLDERNEYEKRLVATLAACPVCKPSKEWLGSFCYSSIAKAVGLWNSEFVSHSTLTRMDLERFSDLVRVTQGYSGGDLSDSLLLIPCSAGKRGGHNLGLPERHLSELLGPEASQALDEGRRLAFARKGVTLDSSAPLTPALALYSGYPYRQDSFYELLGKGMQRGLHCLIISGGYGLLRPEEPIHPYSAHMTTQTLTVWRQRIPLILRDYVHRHGISRSIGVFSAGYSAVVPPDLTGNDRLEIPRLEAGESGSAQTVVPRKVGESIVRILDQSLGGLE